MGWTGELAPDRKNWLRVKTEHQQIHKKAVSVLLWDADFVTSIGNKLHIYVSPGSPSYSPRLTYLGVGRPKAAGSPKLTFVGGSE